MAQKPPTQRPRATATRGTVSGTSTTNGQVTARLPLSADRRRVLPTSDWIASAPSAADAQRLVETKTFAVTHFYAALGALANHVGDVLANITTTLPTTLTGTLLEPDGTTAAARVAVTVHLPRPQGIPPWPDPTAVTNDAGDFMLAVPANIPVDTSAKLTLTIRGANGSLDHIVAVTQLVPLGLVGKLTLTSLIEPLQQSVLDQLMALLPAASPSGETPPAPAIPPQIKLGEADCPITFDYNTSEERFPYNILFRLVEPRTSIVTDTFIFLPVGGRAGAELAIPAWNNEWIKLFGGAKPGFADRVPIDQPISVDGFRDKIVGVETKRLNGIPYLGIGDQETVPMAGTLGLGYVVRFAQKWTPTGLSLGNLVYSLPLAPGEQQKVAVFEQRETMSTVEFETLTDEEQMNFTQTNDSSAQSTFDSAFNESQRGGSSFATHADSSSWGVSASNGLIGGLLGGFGISGGGSSSNNNGNTYSWMDGAKSYSSRAAEQMHGAVERQASSRRRQQRTSMRLASATDTESVTTKIITNNNRGHALTIQYWEVLRHFDVGTAVQGVTLVAFVPLEVVRFLPPPQPLTLGSNFAQWVNNRDEVLARYGPLLKHADVLRKWLPWQYREGLDVLEEFASDPRGIVDSGNSIAQDVIDVSLEGSFLPFENAYITILTKRGTRIGPFKMAPTLISGTTMDQIPPQTFTTENDLLNALRARRTAGSMPIPILGVLQAVTMRTQLFLPPSIGPNDIIGFELSRAFNAFSYQLKTDDASDKLVEELAAGVLLGPLAGLLVQHSQARIAGLNYSAAQLEQLLGGPFIWNFNAILTGVNETYAAGFITENGKVLLPASSYPLPALQVAPVLRFDRLLKIEQTLQHAVRNTITYSKAIWMSLTAEERAIMLEGYTIGVPAGGFTDPATQTVPLLNCVGNEVLGFYGNSMIMPFSIPKAVTDATAANADGVIDKPGMTTGQVQDALTAFHNRDFSPPVAHVALPTRGVLGEAVLGHCPSAEKIDLTRFWNWQDSPIPQAPDINAVTIGKGNTLAGATAPSTLGTVAPVINNIVPMGAAIPGGGATTTGGTDLAAALIGAQQLGDMANITGQTQLAGLIGQTQASADKGRSDAMSNANTLVTTAMKEMSQIVQTGIQAFASIETGGVAGGKGGKGNGKGGSGGKSSGGGSSGSGGSGNG